MLELQKFEKSDFGRLIGWIPDERFLVQWAGPLFTWPLDEQQLDKYVKDTKGEKPKRYIFKAVHLADDKVIGHIEIGPVDHENSIGILSRVLIGKSGNRRKGYGKEMIKLAVDFGFNRISLSRINLAVFDFNEAAISCYKKAGFSKYELKEKAVKCGNECWNVIMMNLRKKDYAEDFSG
jgi:RimJ/RimL family protein N-acetyltransferase